jgi:hypothetical protein
MSVVNVTMVVTKKGKLMSRYATMSDFESMSLQEVEATLEKYLKIAEDSDWDITDAFERDLVMLTKIARAKGSTRAW